MKKYIILGMANTFPVFQRAGLLESELKGDANFIELQTGKIIFPELDITVSPLLRYDDFISDFPKDKIIQIRDMRNGYMV